MHPVFLDEFADYMENFLITNHNIVIAGDLNLHITNQEDPEAQLFTDMMDALGLDCHINFPYSWKWTQSRSGLHQST